MEGGGFYFAGFGGLIANTTIANNSAPLGSEVGLADYMSLTFQNSILSNTSGTNICSHNVDVPLYLGNNLIQDGSCDAVANSQLTGDPLLGPLQDNGGTTLTMALLDGSPALNVGDNSLVPVGVTTDQRGTGFPRIMGRSVDLGAYETSTPAGAKGILTVSSPTIIVADTISIELADSDLAGQITQAVTVEANGDIETVNLTETGTSTGVFTGSINTTYGILPDGDNTNMSLNVQVGDNIIITYVDQLNGDGVVDETTVEIDVIAVVVTCADYSATYTVGTLESDLSIDLRQAVECANESIVDNTIDLDDKTVVFVEAPYAYDADFYNALEPIADVSTAGKLTIQNGEIQRADDEIYCLYNNRENFRFLYISVDGDLTLNDVVLKNGCSNDNGGGDL